MAKKLKTTPKKYSDKVAPINENMVSEPDAAISYQRGYGLGSFAAILADATKKPESQLTAFEKMAKGLDRARSLRRFMEEIAASKAAPAELVDSLALMAVMADWLDPLVKAPWPEVDGVGDRNPHESLW